MADFSSVSESDCRFEGLPDGIRLPESRTIVLQSVLNGIKEHGRSSMHAEVCGVLVGRLCREDGPYLRIDGRIEGKRASHSSGSVTFTSETWDYIHEELAAKHPDRKIVGWYHTHPGFGIFLSGMDAFIHENFFSFPWQPAYVFDPQAETDGFFFMADGKLVQQEVAIVPDVEPSVREPLFRDKGGDRIVIRDDSGRSRHSVAAIASVAFAVILAIAAAALFIRLRESEETAREARAKARSAEAKASGLERDLKEQETSRRREQAEWTVREKTYEKEIEGLRVEVTTISAERASAESENEATKAEIARLEALRAKQEANVRQLEEELVARQGEARRAAGELDGARTQVRRLEERIAALESAVATSREPEPPASEPDAEAASSPEDTAGEAPSPAERPSFWRRMFGWLSFV